MSTIEEQEITNVTVYESEDLNIIMSDQPDIISVTDVEETLIAEIIETETLQAHIYDGIKGDPGEAADHAELSNLSFEDSKHTGFQKLLMLDEILGCYLT